VATSGTGGTTNSIDYFQYINADKFITQGGTFSQFVKGDGSLDSNVVISFNGLTGAVQGVSAAVAGTGISVSGATGAVTITNIGVQSFNGLTGAVTGVSRFNGLTGGVTLAAGTNITLTPSGNTITIAATSNVFDTTVDFSEYINKISCTICGNGSVVDTNPEYFNIYTFTYSEIVTDAFNAYPVTFTTEKIYFTADQWCADLRLTLTNDLNSVEGIINEVVSSFSTTTTELGTLDSWVPTGVTLSHTEATYVIKTITGKSWVTANSFVNCKIVGVTSADHTVEDALLDNVQFDINNMVPGVGFDIVGHAPNGTYGKYGVRCFGN
jgi:hypothetical protein